jgi:hypothetical protein
MNFMYDYLTGAHLATKIHKMPESIEIFFNDSTMLKCSFITFHPQHKHRKPRKHLSS